MDLQIVRPSALSPEDLGRWSDLQTANPAFNSPFLSPGWALAVERAQGFVRGDDPRQGVQVAVLRDGGVARGFLALRVDRSLAMPAGAPMNDYQGLVAEPGVELDPRALLVALGASRFDFSHMLPDQPSFAAYGRGSAAAYRVETPDGYAAYAEQRRAAGSGVLKDIDKRRRKIEREAGVLTLTVHGVAAMGAAPDAAALADFEQLIALKRRQYRDGGQTDIFETPWTLALLRDLYQAGDATFGGALFCLRIDGKLAAAQFNLCCAPSINAWIIAHDEAFERYSPGLVLFGEILRWMDGGPYRVLDLGAGEYRFKHQLSNAQVQVAHGFVGRASPQSLLRAAQYGVRAAAERLPLGPVSALPGKAMRRMDLWRGLR